MNINDIDNHMLQYDEEVWRNLQSGRYTEIYFDEDAAHEQYIDEREENEDE